jgi:isopropylmalate/homocitrate/citramalate synthase
VLGKKSGLASIKVKCEELGLSVPEDRFPALLVEIKKIAIRKRSLLTDTEFRDLGRHRHTETPQWLTLPSLAAAAPVTQ